MTATKRFIGIFTWVLAGISAASHPGMAQSTHLHDEQEVRADQEIGTVDFRVSCEAVREDFDRALALMHHMMYVQAREQFEEIAEAEPECSMAHWGIATTLFQPLWGTRPSEEELQRGWNLIEKARKLGPADERERLLVEATAAFFKKPESTDFRSRIRRWADGMEEAYRANPDDVDTAALYALSRLALAQEAENRHPLHDEAEEVLRAAWEKAPTHPGAVHYSIHATDADGRAENALDIVAVYAEIAPEVPHALHMPSHIYVRLGDWPQVIDWNRRSAEAALRQEVNGAVSHHYIHAIDYLVYAYLQQGEDDPAQAAFEEAMAKERHQPSFISAYHLAAMPARWAVERRQWKEAMALEPRTPDYLPWDEARWPEGLTWQARGLGAVHTGDLEMARESEQRLETLRDQAREVGDQSFATYLEVDRRILAGWIALAENEPDEAVKLIRSAGELERTVEKHAVSPGSLLPPNEALGDLLMELGRPAEALEAYKVSEEIWPGRFNTILGAAQAARAAENEAEARKHYARLIEIAGDSKRPAIDEAREFLGRR